MHFGWPWNYWGGYEDFRVEPRRQELREYTRRPDYALGSHVAPLGLTFASKAALGGGLANGAFVALHGSWNRKPASGYKVVFVPFGADGKPAVTRNAEGKVTGGLPVDVLTGFLDDGDAKGRPTDVDSRQPRRVAGDGRCRRHRLAGEQSCGEGQAGRDRFAVERCSPSACGRG